MQRQPTQIRRSQLAEAAMHILATEGARRLTAQRLAAEVGLTPGAIFRHFSDMQAVLDSVVDRMEDLLFEGFPPEEADPMLRLRAFFLGRVRTVLANPSLSTILLADPLSTAGDARRAERVHAFRRRTQRFVVACLREARSSGVLHPDVVPEEGALLIIGVVLALGHRRGGGADGREGARAERLWSTLERALRR